LTIPGGGKVQLEILVGKDGAELDGSVADKDGKPAPGAVVVLVPETRLRAHPALFRESETDQAGRLQFKNRLPGSYTVLAWDDVEARHLVGFRLSEEL
jgi:hypothetical protein